MAVERNKALELSLPKGPNLPMNKYRAKRGIQRVAAVLTTAGIIPTPRADAHTPWEEIVRRATAEEKKPLDSNDSPGVKPAA